MNHSGLARLAPIVIGLIAICIMALRGCQEGPFGRKQVVQLSHEEEAALGAQAYQKILSESRVVDRGAIVDSVKGIGRRLAAATSDPSFLQKVGLKGGRKFDWEFRVIADRNVNAFCLPGGKVAVFTGILPVAETEQGLAVVMGHEIGHALARHGAERMAQQQMVQVGQLAVASSLGGMDPAQQRTIMGIFGVGSQYGVLLPFSRKHESEADHIGVLLMASAGYDPREAPRFWTRMSRVGGGRAPAEFASTHPSHETRIHDLEGWSDEANVLYQQSERVSDHPLPAINAPSLPRQELPKRPPVKSGMKGKGYQFD